MVLAYTINRYKLSTYIANATVLIEQETSGGDIMSEFRSIRDLRRRTDLANEIAKLNALELHKRVIDSLNWEIEWIGYGRFLRERPIYKNEPFKIIIDSTSAKWYLNRTFLISMDNTSKAIHLYDKGDLDTTILNNEWINIRNWIFKILPLNSASSYSYYGFTIYSHDNLANKQRAKTSYVIDEEQSSTINISSQGHIFEKERDYVNQLCDMYITSDLERKQRIADNTIEFVESQLSIIRDSVSEVEDQLLRFQLNNEIIDLSYQGEFAYNQLESFYQQKLQIIMQNNYLEYLIGYLNKNKNPSELIAPALMQVNDPVLVESVGNLKEKQEERDRLSTIVEENSPNLAQLNAAILKEKQFVLEVAHELIETNRIAREQIELSEQNIENRLLELPGNEQELINIQRKYDVNNSVLTFLLEKRAEVGIQKASTISNINVLNRSNYYNMQTVNNNSTQLYIISLLIALFLPISIMLIVDLVDPRIKEKTDIDNKTTIPIIGVLSHFSGKSEFAVYEEPNSSFAESFRRLKTEIFYELELSKGQTILVTSTLSGEGKTFTALNLACIIAMGQKKTLLLGLDLRKPLIHKLFNDNNEKGLSTYLEGMDSMDQIVHSTHISGLSVSYAGPIPPNPAELIEKEKLAAFLNWAKKEFDYIIVDTPPLALVSDAMLLANHSDVNLFVIRYKYSNKEVLNFLNSLKDKDRFKAIKIVVNDLKASSFLRYDYTYGYGYGYGYYYGSYYRDYTSKEGS